MSYSVFPPWGGREKVDNSTVEVALEVDKVPHIKEGVKRMVEKFWKKQEGLKKSK